MANDEVIYPPRGYCIGFFFGAGGTMVGPFATEAEAREVLANAQICITGAGARPDWDR